MKHLAGKTAIVTGAASGIGRAIAYALVNEGMTVAMADLNFDEAVVTAEPLGDQAFPVAVDVRDPGSVEAAAQATTERFGGISIAVNNAGILNSGVSWELTCDQWRNVLDVNLWGVIHGIRSFVPRIIAGGGEGHVINIASIAALMPVVGTGPYTASKHAVLGISDVLRGDLAAAGCDVGVSVVMPGMVRTAMIPTGIDPSTVADFVVAGIRHNLHYIYTDGYFAAEVEQRFRAISSARDHVFA